MPRKDGKSLEQRVTDAAENTLERQGHVTPIDVLTELGWFHPTHLDLWRQRRVPDLEQLIQVQLEKVLLALVQLHEWAAARGLHPSEAEYLARSRGREQLRFSATGDETIEHAFRTHWISPELSERERTRLAERQSRPPELVVISPLKDFTCSVCGIESNGLLIMESEPPVPVCLACARMDHLEFLPAGDATLTRRAKAASELWAVVVRFSRSRRRYERQGILVERSALAEAER